MSKLLLYLHGKGGSAHEAEHYRDILPGYDCCGVDYTGTLPWEVQGQIKEAYDTLSARYDETVLVTNSIGTYFAMLALQGCKLKKACCISPILNMERLITDMMGWAGVSEAELEQRGEITTDFGETLSWEYLCYVRDNPIHWETPTAILYAGGDHLTARETVMEFAAQHNASVTVMEDGEHWFHTSEQMAFLDEWIEKELE